MTKQPKNSAKARRFNTRYIVGVFKNGRGAGLLTVFAHSQKQAKQCALNLIGKRNLTIESVQSFRKWATPNVRLMAVNKFISDAWNPLMKSRSLSLLSTPRNQPSSRKKI